MAGGYLANVVPDILTTNTTVVDDVAMVYDIDVKEWIILFKKLTDCVQNVCERIVLIISLKGVRFWI